MIFVDCLLLFFLLVVYLCFHSPCTFVRWVPILDFYLQGFSSSLDEYLFSLSIVEVYIVKKSKALMTQFICFGGYNEIGNIEFDVIISDHTI